MNNRRKRQLITNRIVSVSIVFLCLLVIIGVIVIFKKDKTNKINESDDLIYNSNDSFLKDHKIIGVVFKDIKCTYDGNNSLVSYTIVNETNKKINLYNYEIVIKDDNKNTLAKIEFNYNNSLLPNKEVQISNSVVGVDLSDARYMNLRLNTKNSKK